MTHLHRGLATLWLLLLLSACGSSEPTTRGNILILGDSLSAGYGIDIDDGWVALLRERLDDANHRGQVINASENGATSSDGLARLPGLLERHNPRLLVLELGGNDGLRGVSASKLRRNLRQMIGMAEDAGARVILVRVQLPPRFARMPADAMRSAYREAAEGSDTVLTQFLPLDKQPPRSMMQIDGIHPRASAQETMLDSVWPAIRDALQ